MPSTAQVTPGCADVSWYDAPATELPPCPHCLKTAPVALLSKIEKGRHTAQTWICRECLSSFGDVDEWRRRIKRSELLRAGIGVLAALGVSALILHRKTRKSTRAAQQRSPAFV